MKILIINTILFFLINASKILSFPIVEDIVPKPRQAYNRLIYSTPFTINNKTKIFLDPENPQFLYAYKINSLLKNKNIDTLEIKFWNSGDTILNGIIISLYCSFINNLFVHIPDQRVAISSDYPGKSGYILDVLPNQVIISGSDEIGIDYCINTFIQLLDNENNPSILPCRVIDVPEFPVRWFYYPTNILIGDNINKAKKIWDEAVSYKLNGVCLSDYKFSNISYQPKRYYDSLVSLKEFAKEKNLTIIPMIFPFGWSNSILFWNPNLAAGLPVQAQKFIIQGDTAKIVNKDEYQPWNRGFETYNGNSFPGFRFIDEPGKYSFVDTIEFHSGKASIKFENFSLMEIPNARICYETKIKPYTTYLVSAYVKTNNFGCIWGPRIAVLNKKGNNLCYADIIVQSTTSNWEKVNVVFNSLNNDSVLIYWGAWGATNGTIWWDDLSVEEVAFINLLRRKGTPLIVSHPILDLAYTEGIDYDSLIDTKLGRTQSWAGEYDIYHQAPTFKIKKEGKLKNGDSINISYYHTTVIYNDQVMITMSEPEVYEILEKEFKILDSLLKPNYYFMNHDEIRVLNWDMGDLSRGLKPSQILSDNVDKCIKIIKKYNQKAEILDWSDMFDEYHNAQKSDYYFVNGDLTGIADLISKDIIIANWNHYKEFLNTAISLDFFSKKGFKQIGAPFYDMDESHIRNYKERAQGTENFIGMLYTTWTSNYNFLTHFAEYTWNHPPYIWHYPSWDIEPSGDILLPIKVTGDKWDSGWKIEEFKIYYRTNISSNFVNKRIFLNSNIDTLIILKLPDKNEFLQYYFTARDNRGWLTKIPFGENYYFELGKNNTSVESNSDINVIIAPNPTEGLVKVKFLNQFYSSIKLKILNSLCETLQIIEDNNVSELSIDFSNYASGIYYIIIIQDSKTFFEKIIKL